jgi:hypothetical protein
MPSSYRSWVLDRPDVYQCESIRMPLFYPCLSVSTLYGMPDTPQFRCYAKLYFPSVACHVHLHNHPIVGGKMAVQPSGNAPI